MSNYKIFTDSACDLTKEMREKYDLDYFRMGITVDGVDYPCDLNFEAFSSDQLYNWVGEETHTIKTSLIQMQDIIDRTRKYLDAGNDILYIACTSKLSGSWNIFRIVAQELEEDYPDRKIVVYDSCRAGMALGLMVMDACEKQKAGASFDEIIKWLDEEKQTYNLCGTVKNLTYLKNAGRVSGAAAFFANMFNIKPVIVADTLGHNYVINKVRGLDKAYDELFKIVKRDIEGMPNPVVYLGQGMAQEAVNYFKKRLTDELHVNIIEYTIGPAIGISCGPGLIHLVYKGKPQTITAPDE